MARVGLACLLLFVAALPLQAGRSALHPLAPMLARYELPGGGNLARSLHRSIARTLEAHGAHKPEFSFRVFGSAAYLMDREKVDWRHVGDLDVTVYLDQRTEDVVRLHARGREIERDLRTRVARSGQEEGWAGLFDGGVPHDFEDMKIFPESALRENEGSFDWAAFQLVLGPNTGYLPQLPHFGTSATIARIRPRSAADEMPREDRLARSFGLYDTVLADARLKAAERGSDVKVAKRLIQLAVLRGDERGSRSLRRFLGPAAASGADGLVARSRATLLRLRLHLALWRAGLRYRSAVRKVFDESERTENMFVPLALDSSRSL